MEQILIVMTNMPDSASAKVLARSLVEQKLVACVNCLSGMHSIYHWQGAVEEADECMLWMKTTSIRYAELEAAINAAHPYDLPEIVAIPVAAGLPAYLAWVAAQTSKAIDA